jgi:hypothetical protein
MISFPVYQFHYEGEKALFFEIIVYLIYQFDTITHRYTDGDRHFLE